MKSFFKKMVEVCCYCALMVGLFYLAILLSIIVADFITQGI